MTRLPALLLAACACWLGTGGDAPRADSTPKGGVVTLGAIPVVTLRPGESTTVVIPVVIAEGFHVQANPASSEFLIPLELELALEEADSVVWWRVVYPRPGAFRLEGTTDDLLTYHDSIGVEVAIRATAEAQTGERFFAGKLRYQACDTKRCLFPTTVAVSFKVVLSEDSASE